MCICVFTCMYLHTYEHKYTHTHTHKGKNSSPPRQKVVFSTVKQVYCFLNLGPQASASESTDFFSQDSRRFSHSEIRGLTKRHMSKGYCYAGSSGSGNCDWFCLSYGYDCSVVLFQAVKLGAQDHAEHCSVPQFCSSMLFDQLSYQDFHGWTMCFPFSPKYCFSHISLKLYSGICHTKGASTPTFWTNSKYVCFNTI